MHWCRGLLIGIWTVGCGVTASAADGNGDAEYFQDFPVVLSASRLKQPQSEAPNAMTVIDRSMIVASGFRNIVDLFRLVPGMYVGYDTGHTPFVSYHGSSDQYARRMQVQVDGRTVYLPPTGGVDWNDIPLNIDDIERIEVIRGPAAASHGANSLQGVINITSRDASSVDGASVSLRNGNGGISDVAARIGKADSDFDYRLTLASNRDYGYDLPVLNEGSRTNQMNVRGNYRFNAQDSVDVQFGYSDGLRGAGNKLRLPNEPFRTYNVLSDFQQIDWLRALTAGEELKVNYYHIARSYLDNQAPVLEKESYQAHRHELGLQRTTALGMENRLVWGGMVRRDTLVAPTMFKSPQAASQYQVFAHDEFRPMAALVFNVGAMYEDDGLGHRNWSPRASVNYHLAANHTLRASTSVAYRNPVLFENQSNTSYVLSRPYKQIDVLRPERILSHEIGYLGELRELGLTLDTRVYQDRMSDYIFLNPYVRMPPAVVAPVLTFNLSNLYAANIYGFESTLKYHWSEYGNLVLNYAHQHATCSGTGAMILPVMVPTFRSIVNQCPMIVPPDSGSVLWNQKINSRLQLSAGYYHQEKVQLFDAQWPQNVMHRVDLRIAYAVGKKGQSGSGEVAMVVQDAFQNNSTEYSNVKQKAGFMFNRRTWLTATLEL